MKTKNDMMGKNTDASAKTIAETNKEVVKEYNNETAENGGGKIIEVYSNLSIWKFNNGFNWKKSCLPCSLKAEKH